MTLHNVAVVAGLGLFVAVSIFGIWKVLTHRGWYK